MSNEGDPQLTFEQALAKLETLVGEIESGRVSLEESISKYEEGTKLIDKCRLILNQAEKKIQLLARGDNGELKADGELDD